MARQVVKITWDEVAAALAPIDKKDAVIFGVPRGGMCALSALRYARPTHDPVLADFIVDDVVDSGATRARWVGMYPETPFVGLFRPVDGVWFQFPWESEAVPTDAVTRLLEYCGEDVTREGLLDTPKRYVKALAELTSGYGKDPAQILGTTFASDADEMVVVTDIPFSSLCEHHVLPFHGTVAVGYIPDGRVVGLSKIPRLIHALAARLQIQEQLTVQIARAIEAHVPCKGVGVVVRAHHTCMSMRGVRSHGNMVTNALFGKFRDGSVRAEFLGAVGAG